MKTSARTTGKFRLVLGGSNGSRINREVSKFPEHSPKLENTLTMIQPSTEKFPHFWKTLQTFENIQEKVPVRSFIRGEVSTFPEDSPSIGECSGEAMY